MAKRATKFYGAYNADNTSYIRINRKSFSTLIFVYGQFKCACISYLCRLFALRRLATIITTKCGFIIEVIFIGCTMQLARVILANLKPTRTISLVNYKMQLIIINLNRTENKKSNGDLPVLIILLKNLDTSFISLACQICPH